MNLQGNGSRRTFLAIAGTGLLALTGAAAARAADDDDEDEEEVGPAEDLMREHGALVRMTLIYSEAARRIEAGEAPPCAAIAAAAGLVRSFVEDYHEKLEEQHLFPRFKAAGRLVDLVTVLATQHEAGRQATDVLLKLAAADPPAGSPDARRMADVLRAFVRMYLPHLAREDTVLFPAFREIVKPAQYEQLGELFEKREHQLFGEKGFVGVVEKVAAVEKELGLYDLAQFTPKL